MRISVLEDMGALERFSAEWSEFVWRQPASTPFHDPVWLTTWWKHFGSGQLHVIVFRDSSRLVSVLPCFLHEWNNRRQLTLIGSGITDYLDPLIASGCEQAVVEELDQHLSGCDACEVIDWTDIRSDHAIFRLRGARREEWIPRSRLCLHGSFSDFWTKRGKDLRRNARRYRERAEKVGELRFEIHENGAPDLIKALISLHAKRWEVEGQAGMIAENRANEFLAEVTPKMCAHGIGCFFVVRYRRDIAAILFALKDSSTIYSYLSAFDPRYAEFALGRTLLYEAFQFAFGHYRAWDFLRGDEHYKREWGGQLYACSKLRLERRPAASG